MRATKTVQLLWLLLVALAAQAEGAIDQGKLVYFCDQAHSRVSIDLDKQVSSMAMPGYAPVTVNWGDLLILKPAGNSSYKDGSKVDARRCGQIEVRIESGYVNPDINGQSGAEDFPVVELRMADRTILPRTSLQVCSLSDRMENYFFGPCPDNWANEIKTEERADGRLQITVVRKFSDANDQAKQRTDIVIIK